MTQVQAREKAGLPAHKIILWYEPDGAASDEHLLSRIRELAEVKYPDMAAEVSASKALPPGYAPRFRDVREWADLLRCLLLCNYGGCWFDLDVMFLRSFDPLFARFGDDPCVYQWEKQRYPNNAIFWWLHGPSRRTMADVVAMIAERDRGWGFQQARLTYDLPLPLLVLPCAWFDASWIPNPRELTCDGFFGADTEERLTRETLFPGAFAYHWHNRWGAEVAPRSPFAQLLAALEAER